MNLICDGKHDCIHSNELVSYAGDTLTVQLDTCTVKLKSREDHFITPDNFSKLFVDYYF
ncbi:hypothetical protein TDB9533_03996 [Thalassocella blandensis]|nr:hypothetical protein TDB9533_03996 [Thalassocella blandensis]